VADPTPSAANNQAATPLGSAVADRYAQASFDLAAAAGTLEGLDADFKTLTAAFAMAPDLRAVAASPLIAAEDKARALVKIAEKLGLSGLGVKVVGLVARNGRAEALPHIAAAFARRLAEHRGVQPVEIIAAAPLTPGETDAILKALSTATGRTVDGTVRIDPSLIGGFIARVGSRQFDASVRAKLNALKLAMKA
jgi:F-type H+-transporting ATPase subunit delta